MAHFKVCIYAALFFLLGSCAATKEVATPGEWKGNSLQFGSGGGFTGASDIYTLLDNGQLFLESGIVNPVTRQLPKVDKEKAKELFTEAAKINWGEKDISEPGNMYTKVIYTGTDIRRQIIWGNINYTPAAEITQLYNNLKAIISSPEKK